MLWKKRRGRGGPKISGQAGGQAAPWKVSLSDWQGVAPNKSGSPRKDRVEGGQGIRVRAVGSEGGGWESQAGKASPAQGPDGRAALEAESLQQKPQASLSLGGLAPISSHRAHCQSAWGPKG